MPATITSKRKLFLKIKAIDCLRNKAQDRMKHDQNKLHPLKVI